jgi:inorganic phosphate transporter, PiT family
MVSAWIITMPSAGAVGALAYAIANGIGGNTGVILVFLGVIAIGSGFYLLSRKTKVTPDNVNDDWTGTVVSATAQAAA